MKTVRIDLFVHMPGQPGDGLGPPCFRRAEIAEKHSEFKEGGQALGMMVAGAIPLGAFLKHQAVMKQGADEQELGLLVILQGGEKNMVREEPVLHPHASAQIFINGVARLIIGPLFESAVEILHLGQPIVEIARIPLIVMHQGDVAALVLAGEVAEFIGGDLFPLQIPER
ncbi:MAG: hypothetical protein BWY77_01490 [bacterium ADurb.Bin431]|nr:MAG: hypothetical protein BWY77_01490 [bacterium ADurb.Bin431]